MTGEVERALRTGRAYPPERWARVLEAERTVAPDYVAEALGIEPGDPVIRRVRVTHEDDRPVSWSTSWFASRFPEAPRLLEPARIPEGTFAYLANARNRTAVAWADEWEPSLAVSVDEERLGVARGAPVHRGFHRVYDEDGDILEYGESVSVGRVGWSGGGPS